MDPIKCKRFAELAHAGKLYNEGVPYTVHLEHVVNVLSRFGFTHPKYQCAGWLHDAMEDAGKSYNDIKNIAGFDVAEIVYFVTDEKGRNRKEKHERTYPAMRSEIDAKIVKLCDRISNVENCISNNRNLLEMYKKEYPKFKEYLYIEGELEDMWKYLDTLLK